MRLKHIAEVSFRTSESTNFDTFIKSLQGETISASEVVLFVAKGGDQLVFVSPRTSIAKNGDGDTVEVLASRRLRIRHGRWNPLMLANYASDVGIELVGLKRFEEFYKDLVETRRADRR